MGDSPIWKVHPLLGTMWKTKNARFHAADRLRSRALWKSIALSLLSVYVIGLSVVPKFVQAAPGHNGDYLGLVTLLVSLIILVLSVLAFSDDDKTRSGYMHDNAREIGRLYHDFKLQLDAESKGGPPAPPSAEINGTYQQALQGCPYNHDQIDWLKTEIDIAREEKRSAKLKSTQFFFWMFYDVYFWPALAIIAPSALTYFLFQEMLI